MLASLSPSTLFTTRKPPPWASFPLCTGLSGSVGTTMDPFFHTCVALVAWVHGAAWQGSQSDRLHVLNLCLSGLSHCSRRALISGQSPTGKLVLNRFLILLTPFLAGLLMGARGATGAAMGGADSLNRAGVLTCLAGPLLTSLTF